jgi:hypothetical protein
MQLNANDMLLPPLISATFASICRLGQPSSGVKYQANREHDGYSMGKIALKSSANGVSSHPVANWRMKAICSPVKPNRKKRWLSAPFSVDGWRRYVAP